MNIGDRLSTKVLARVGALLVVAVAGITVLAYRGTFDNVLRATLRGLQDTVTAQARHDGDMFYAAQHNTEQLRREWLRRIDALGDTDPLAEFERWFARGSDGVLRLRPELDDAARRPSVYVRADVAIDATLRRRLLAAFELLHEWGPPLTQRQYSASIDLPGIGLVTFSPGVNRGALADISTTNAEEPPVRDASPERNPSRSNRWSAPYFDDKAGLWMVSTSTPVDHRGRWIGSASQHLPIDTLIARVRLAAADGSYQMLFNDRGELVAHPVLGDRIQAAQGLLRVDKAGDSELSAIAQALGPVDSAPADEPTRVGHTADGRLYLAAATVPGPQWQEVGVYPRHGVEQAAQDTARRVLAAGGLMLLAVLLLLGWLLRRHVSAPLLRLRQSMQALQIGQAPMPKAVTGGELGQLSDDFDQMARAIVERDQSLQAKAEQLKQEVFERAERERLIREMSHTMQLSANAAEQRIVHMATHDALTGLPNRAQMQQVLGGLVSQGIPTAVLFIDLDRFKHVNDSLGHGAGDQLLVQMSQLMAGCVRPGDLLSRLGGDEFVVLLPKTEDEPAAARVAQRMLDAMARPVEIQGQMLHCTPSIGIALHPRDGDEPATLVRAADIAMYEAKRQGRNRLAHFRPVMTRDVEALLGLEVDLRRGIERGEFELWLQPKMRLGGDHAAAGAEALLRWRRPDLGVVPPAEFLPAAHERGLMGELNEHVLETACTMLARWHAEGRKPLPLSVNLSADHFTGIHLVSELADRLARHGVPASWLRFEITESTLLQEDPGVIDRIHALRSMGVQIALDDFGTGYSSLSYLERIPVDELKIDRSFIQGIRSDAGATPLVRAIVGLGKGMGLTVVAEGVESATQAEVLHDLGCDQGQGFHFARPMPAADFERWMDRRGTVH